MTEYVLGFAFSSGLSEVALIYKNKPQWQSGLINGIGGKLEEGETPAKAMAREFLEETSVDIHHTLWKQYATLQGEGFKVNVFYTISDDIENIQTVTAEKVAVFRVYNVLNSAATEQILIPNLYWLIPMAISVEVGRERCKHFTIIEN